MTVKTALRVAIAAVLGGLPAVSRVSAEPVRLRVAREIVELHALPDEKSDIAGHVREGDIVTADTAPSRNALWIEVAPPRAMILWVHGSYVSNGLVTASSLHVRSGPGSGYRPVGELARGERVSVVHRLGDWYAIESPPAARVWVFAGNVEPVAGNGPPPDGKKPTGGNAGAATSPPTAVSRDAGGGALAPEGAAGALPESLKFRKLRAAVPQGRTVTLSGVVQPSEFGWRRPSRYCLRMDLPGGRAYTLRYLVGDADVLFPAIGKMVCVEGREYWLEGVRSSVVSAVSVSEIAQAPGE
jgi:hypothetical protein